MNVSTESDDSTARTRTSCAEQRAEHLSMLGSKNVLELCVGPSLKTLEVQYSKHGIQVTGNDLEPRWKSYYPKGKWIIGDARLVSTKGFDIENPDTNLNIYSYELDNYFNIFIDGEQTTFEDIAYTSFFYGSEVHKERKRYMSKNGLGPGVYLPRSVDNCFFTFVALDSTATVKICSKVPTATYGGMIEGADYPKSFGSIWTQDFFLEDPRFYYADHLYTINEDGFEALEFKINPTVFRGVTDFTTYCEDSIDSTRVYFTFNNSSVLANVPANEYLATIVVDEVPYAFYMPEGGYDGTHFFNMLSQYIEQTNSCSYQ